MKSTRYLSAIAIVAALSAPTFALAADPAAKTGDAVEAPSNSPMTGEATGAAPAEPMTGEASEGTPGDAMTGETITGEANDAQPDGAVAEGNQAKEFQTIAPGEIKTSEFVGQRVYTMNDEWIGEVGDVVMSADGSLETIVVDYGGWVGIGEKQVAVGLDKIEFRTDGDTDGDYYVYVDMSKEEFETAAEYNADNRLGSAAPNAENQPATTN